MILSYTSERFQVEITANTLSLRQQNRAIKVCYTVNMSQTIPRRYIIRVKQTIRIAAELHLKLHSKFIS